MDKTEFGKRLRYLRAEAGYTQEKLAELSDMSTVYLGEIERGKSCDLGKRAQDVRRPLLAWLAVRAKRNIFSREARKSR